MTQSEAGTKAEESGVYKVIHENNHYSRHYVIALRGDTLPGWIYCTNRVRFELALTADHVYQHELFKHAAHPKSAW